MKNSIMVLLSTLLRIPSERLQRILMIALPLIGGMLSQSVLNLVDAAMVGRLGEVPLAAVGIGSYANFLIVSAVMGISTSVQALVARRFGSHLPHGSQSLNGTPLSVLQPLIAGIWVALLIAIPVTFGALMWAHVIIPYFNRQPDVAIEAIAYFEWRSLGLFAVGANIAFRGFFSGIGDVRDYLTILLTIHVLNVLFSYFLIFGIFGWDGFGAQGSAMGTTLAIGVGTCMYARLIWREHIQGQHKWWRIALPSFNTLLSVVRITLPASAQQVLFALGICVLFWIIGQVGTHEQAVGHILISLSLFLILPAVGLGIASASLVGQSLGKKEPHQAHRWAWEVVRLGVLIIGLLGLPLCLEAHWVLSLFTHDPVLINIGLWPLRLTGACIVFELVAMVLTQSLHGAGASRQVLRISSVMQWGILLPTAFLVGPVLGGGLLGIWLVQSAQRIALSVLFTIIWQRRQWASITL